MEVLECIKTRRSVKSYTEQPVEREIIEKIAEAGTYAPTGMNWQSPVILAVTNKEMRDKLASLNGEFDPLHRKDPFYGAPVVLVVLADKSKGTRVYDGSLVMGNMLLAAHALGVGACWIHRAKETFETAEGKKILEELGLQGEYEGVGNCVVGYPKGALPAMKPRKENWIYRID